MIILFCPFSIRLLSFFIPFLSVCYPFSILFYPFAILFLSVCYPFSIRLLSVSNPLAIPFFFFPIAILSRSSALVVSYRVENRERIGKGWDRKGIKTDSKRIEKGRSILFLSFLVFRSSLVIRYHCVKSA